MSQASHAPTLSYARVETPTEPPASIFRNRNFILLWCAYGISALGDHLSEMGLLKLQDALSDTRTDSVRIQAIMLLTFMSPFVVFGPVCGWLADRLPRKWIMFTADLIRGAIMVEMLWLLRRFDADFAAGTRPLSLHLAVIPLILMGIFAATFSPARLSLLPTIIRPGQLIRANAMTAGLGMIATILSAVVGGLIIDHVTPSDRGVFLIFRLDALTFLVSAACIFLIRPPPRHEAGESHSFAAIAHGFRYIARHHRVAELILVSTILWTAAAVVRSLIPAIVKGVFGGSYGDLGIYQGLLGLGLVVGSVLLAMMGNALKSELAMTWSLEFAGLSGVLLTVAVWLEWSRYVCGAGLFLIGMFGAGIQVSVNASIQRMVPNYMRGRVFGVHDLCTVSGLCVATGVLGIPDWPNIDHHIVWIMALVALTLIAAGIITTVVRLRRGRFGPALTFWKNLSDFYCRLWARVRREGLCTIPLEGPVILAANHNSTLDPFILGAGSPNRVPGYMIAVEYAKIPLFSRLVESIECVPVTRSGVDTASVKAALRHLAAGKLLGIFPQGRVQNPLDPIVVREGVGMLALRSGATVIPAYISGVKYSDGVLGPFFRRHRAVVRYGPPIDMSRFKGREKDREAYKEAAEYIMEKILALGTEEE